MQFSSTSVDATPDFSFNTLQFENEKLNVIVLSVILAFILGNIVSIVSKLVQFAPSNRLSFRTCRRFMIFSNSDDPVLLWKWSRGKYSYYEGQGERNEQRRNLKLLIVPLLARFFILSASIASIAISIPIENRLAGCENGDFRPILNLSLGRISSVPAPPCVIIPTTSQLGTVTSTLKFCSFVQESNDPRIQSVSLLIALLPDHIIWGLNGRETFSGFRSFLEWKSSSGRSFRSIPSLSMTLEQLNATFMQGLVELGETCSVGPIFTQNATVVVSLRDCDLTPAEVVPDLNSFLASSVVLEEVAERQLRADGVAETTMDCPIEILLNRPLVNLFPLLAFLVAIAIANWCISAMLRKCGNILDSSFHVTKEIFGRDCTSNPLEERVDVIEQVDELPLQEVF